VAERLARALLPSAAVAAALLAFLPRGEAPFSEPKRSVLVWAAAGSLALLPFQRRRPEPILGLWVASAAASAVLGLHAAPAASATALGASALALAWSIGLDRGPVLRAAAGAGVAVGVVALAQAAGWDPFAGWAPRAEGSRLRVYATLGNPDFVASALTVVLALVLGEAAAAVERRARAGWILAALLVAAGLGATRSLATAVALAAGLAAALVHRGRGGGPVPAAAVAAGALALALASAPAAGRPLADVAAGRTYLWRVAAPHLLDAPAVGLGPGAVERLWPAWELAFWKARCGEDASCVGASPERRFAGRQDHLHQDALETLAERGLRGLAALAAAFALALHRAAARKGPRASALVGALTASAARANFDFPLSRPADLVLLAALVGLACNREDP
jgi:hypothetical protein